MEREDRYLVLKRSDLKKYLGKVSLDYLGMLSDAVGNARIADGKEPLRCVVVEHDWPEYKTVWGLIAARVDAQKGKLLGWTLEEFAIAAEYYRAQTGKNPLSTLEGACDVHAYWIATHDSREVKLPEPHPYHEAPVDLGWARALFGKVKNSCLPAFHG